MHISQSVSIIDDAKRNSESKVDITGKESDYGKLPAETDETDGQEDDTGWRCACEGGFLPPGLLKSMGGAEAVFRMSAGQC